MFFTAKACSDGQLQKCHCAQEVPSERPDVKWGSCGDNTHKAKHIARKFMKIKHPNEKFNDVLEHSVEIGIRAVIDNEKVHCHCPGGCKYDPQDYPK